MTTLREKLILVNSLKDELKARSRIFNIDAKERCAIAFGLPMDTYYEYSYVEWRKASERFQFLLDEQSRQIEEYADWEDSEVLKVLGGNRPIRNMAYSLWTRRFLVFRAFLEDPIEPYITMIA
jgi:hypothetical protein